MALRSVVRVVRATLDRIGGSAGAERTALAIDDGHPHAERSEIDAGDDAHGPSFIAVPDPISLSGILSAGNVRKSVRTALIRYRAAKIHITPTTPNGVRKRVTIAGPAHTLAPAPRFNIDIAAPRCLGVSDG